ncbi:Ku protein [Streptomyces sp. NBC_00199]|uniref:non-homologous end joining protein Ku n=1 Tax=Streptomyces sp. NBC_00199 TaxID=2975678 RepID=UPI002255D239|nr:Ku protein [Streptomyces sp. NBC_00199]MCX5267210.1 Ku protein [Streptomyces sp. NBC_00199]
MLHVRSIWNGAISFGLVSIPIKLVNATENHSISFRQIHTEDGGRIRYRKVCELEEREVTSAEIGKGYEDADGTIIPITDEDLSHLPLPTAKTIEIVAFVPADRIDPLQMDAAYYLQAGGAPAAKPYTLLREALKRSHKVAIAKYALRGRERLGMLRVVGEAIAMHGLLWPDEVRAPEGMAPDTSVTVRDNELDLADALMDTLGEVDLEDLHDEYREAVEEVVAAKAAGEAPPEAPAAPSSGKVLDLMAALEKSVRAAKESRGEASDSEQEPEAAEKAEVRRLPQRKSAGASPKQTGGKKSTSTARKSTSTAARKSTAAPRKSTAKSAQAAKKTTASGSTARKTAAKKTTSTAKKTTSGTSAKSAAGTSAKATAGTGAKAAAKKTAKKATPRKRTA